LFCDSAVLHCDISDTCREIFKFPKRGLSSKRAIILTAHSVHEINDFFPIEHKFKFERLSEESQKIMLDKKIEFQCCKVTMRSVLQRHGNVEHVLVHELVTDLVTEGTPVNRVGRLRANTNYYAVRVLGMKTRLLPKSLRKANDVFAVGGKRREYLLEIVYLGKNVLSVCLEEIDMKHFRDDMSSMIIFSCKKRCGKFFPGNRLEIRSKDFGLG
jgi:hypothetical protein